MRNLWMKVRQIHVPESSWAEYHENSKTGRQAFTAPRGDEEAKAWMKALDRRPFANRKQIQLPAAELPGASLNEVLRGRRSARGFSEVSLSMESISALLHAGYGVTERRDSTLELRTVPSAGAMYPLEVMLAIGPGHAIPPGLYA